MRGFNNSNGLNRNDSGSRPNLRSILEENKDNNTYEFNTDRLISQLSKVS